MPRVMQSLLLLAGLLAGAAGAQGPGQDPGSRPTREFVAAAAQSDAFEMLEAYTALTASRDPQVRTYAQAMLRDHAQTSRALADAAARAELKPPPMAVSADQAQLLGALQSQGAAEFDRTYWQQQALSHRSALLVQQRYATTGDTPALRQAAAAAVPMVQQHLTIAERMAAMGPG